MKKVLSLALALVMSLTLAVPTLAVEKADAETAAWELYNLGLFQGTGTDGQGFPIFDLDQAPTRAQSVTMLVRLLGQEEAAKAGTWTNDFTDVPAWAAPYVGYAYANGLTTGRSAEVFDPDSTVSATEYLTFVLRALGYRSGSDFAWDSAWTLSDKLEITDGSYNAQTNKNFLRGDVAWISASALDAKEKGSSQTLRDKLAAMGIDGGDLYRCQLAYETIYAMPNEIVFVFSAAQGSKEAYTAFAVNSLTVNGVPAKLEQYTTPAQVKELAKKMTEAQGSKVDLGNAFNVVVARYDEQAAKDKAEDFYLMNDGSTVPVPVFDYKFNATGTLKDGVEVTELFVIPLYHDGYGSKFDYAF